MLIILCWLVYSCSYVGKVNYAANINLIMDYYSVTHAQAGLVSTLFFFSYGIGQVVNGFLCKKYNIKRIILASLVISAAINLAVALSPSFAIIKYVWMLNGFVLSILWPTLIRLLSETLSVRSMSSASVIMGTTVAVGTFFVYGVSAIIALFASFKWVFYIAAAVLFSVSIAWIFGLDKAVVAASDTDEPEPLPSKEQGSAAVGKAGAIRLVYLSIVALAVYGIATNLIKDGLTTWVPSILKENYGIGDSMSIILTLTLPMISVFANAFAVGMHKRVNDFIYQCAIAFLISGAVICVIIAGLAFDALVLTVICFIVVCFMVSSCNSLITSIFPLFMKGKVNSGKIAGILNGFCYVGSTISSYGLGLIADRSGWLSVFKLLLGVCAAMCVIALIYAIIKARISRPSDKTAERI